MPVPLHTSLQSIVHRLVNVVWVYRMDAIDKRSIDDSCQTHINRNVISLNRDDCILNLNKIADQYVIYVLHKQTHNLMEKWTFVLRDSNSYSRSSNDSTNNLSELSDIATLVDELPATHLQQLYFVSGCCISDLKARAHHGQKIEFASTDGDRANLMNITTKFFQLSKGIDITVEYDMNAFWTNQMMSAVKEEEGQQQQNVSSYEDQLIHPLTPLPSTTSTTTDSSSQAYERDQPTVTVQQPSANASPILSPQSNSIPLSTSPTVSVRRLSRLSISAIKSEAAKQDEEGEGKRDENCTADHLIPLLANTIPIPISNSRAQYTHHHYTQGGRRTSITYSTSPRNAIHQGAVNSNHSARFQHLLPQESTTSKRRDSTCLEVGQHRGSLVGSFEESLLSGRMSFMPLSKSIDFHCQIGVLGQGSSCKASLKCPPHWTIPFPATFYSQSNDKSEDSYTTTPYVGTVDIQQHVVHTLDNPSLTGYRIPPKGQLQFVVKNPNKTAVKLFLIPYDFTDMPRNTKTFLRQTSYQVFDKSDSQQQQQDDKEEASPKKVLRYAIHMQFLRNEKKRIYLYKTIRIVFVNRKLDMKEKLDVVCEGPKEPVYSPV